MDINLYMSIYLFIHSSIRLSILLSHMQSHLQLEFIARIRLQVELTWRKMVSLHTRIKCFYHFLIFVILSAFMFSKQKIDLKLCAFI